MKFCAKGLSVLLLSLVVTSCDGSKSYISPACSLEGDQNEFACIVKASQSSFTDPDEVRTLFLSGDHSPEGIELMLHSMLVGDRDEGYITALGGFGEDARQILIEAIAHMYKNKKTLEGSRIQLYLPKDIGNNEVSSDLRALGGDVVVKTLR